MVEKQGNSKLRLTLGNAKVKSDKSLGEALLTLEEKDLNDLFGR